ncbi:DUF3224 domain-containing protein [Parasphingorhabdus halotolerans]|uniref:DUF3224 domain-containing protein n=1 Tax=Parasphingorhabdus halotolerans TaxID=2725558 RepID=A0A6H2DPD3_9SPHN|nr:DUF3224 domain-containing protein [Parasphingorhabdus halotolerans]QJB69843.1 DUF3224 domain-containing protein [Parasphingorhabdus halotolerans]
MQTASGDFEVEMKPVSGEGEDPARMSIGKTFTGDLTGTSTGQMMMGGTEETGARVYVALETITGSLGGKDGSFIAAHRGTMSPKGQELSIIIVPDSGTGALAGITGTMEIDNVDGAHSYTVTYNLPE